MSDAHEALTPLAALEARLNRLEDARAVEQLKYRYAAHCDNAYDAQGIASLFTPDGRWVVDGEGGSNTGRVEITEHFKDLPKKILWAQHYVINPQVEIAEDGLSAIGNFRLLCLCTIARTDDAGAQDAVILTIDYTDRFVKRDGQWYFQELRGRTHQVSNWDQGWVKQPFRG
ncbi:nuclear transport factor 2 family protein [Streptomyces sp. NPDC056039]|uniref:nuclear transport factor 2 family protein n=1 Tax=Streptomyces sp. NPDC056039 TaxID=3345687 RepID=UPI0035DB6283